MITFRFMHEEHEKEIPWVLFQSMITTHMFILTLFGYSIIIYYGPYT